MRHRMSTKFQYDYNNHNFASPIMMYVIEQFMPKFRTVSDSGHVRKPAIDLTPDELPDLAKITQREVEFAAKAVALRADWFSTQEYMELWGKYFVKFLTSHAKVKTTFETVQDGFPDDWFEQITLVRNLLDVTASALKRTYSAWHARSVAEDFDSDLETDPYPRYNISYIEKISVMRTFAGNMGKMQDSLSSAKSDHKKVIGELRQFEERHRYIAQLYTKVVRSEIILRFYLKSTCAKEMKDMFKPILIGLDDREEERFKIYHEEFKKNIVELTGILSDDVYLSQDRVLTAPKSEAFKILEERLGQIIMKID